MILALSLGLTMAAPQRFIMAHYMPWFQAPPVHKEYGWHWTMNHFDPGKDELASKFHPSIGMYDSQDPDVIEYQLLTMKLAGIDGVLIDWYGIDNLWDYPFIHRSSQLVFEMAAKFDMKFGVMYEDQTLKFLIENKVVAATDAVTAGRRTMEWLEKNWFHAKNYLRIGGKPALMVFGPQYYKPEDWGAMLAGINVSFYTLHHRRGVAIGAFDWPLPEHGTDGCEKERIAFLDRAKAWPNYIAAAYPRFEDIYKAAGVRDSYGVVDDLKGATYRRLLEEALKGPAPMVQIATWNDWGEGTQIEPSKEFGNRDLVATQELRKKYLEPGFDVKANDIRTAALLYRLRKQIKDSDGMATLNKISDLLARRETAKAWALIETFGLD